MRVGLSHWCSEDNLGDLAIAIAQVQRLKECSPHHELLVMGVEDGVHFPGAFASYPTIRSPWGSLGTVGALRWMISMISGLGTLVSPRARVLPRAFRDFASRMDELDVLMPKGGGYLYARGGLRGVLFTLRTCWPLLLARRLGVRRVLWGHSVGPAESRIGGRLLRASLQGADITVRDSQSVNLLKRWEIPAVRKPDLAFHWKRATGNGRTREAKGESGACVVGVTARLVASGPEQSRYERSIADALRAVVLQASNEGLSARIALIPQVIGPTELEDDRLVLERISKLLPIDCFMEDLSHTDVPHALSTFASLDFLVATRLHSAILASCAGVPFVVLEYVGGKAEGAVEDLQLPRWVRATDREELVLAAERAWRVREQLKDRILRTVPALATELETLHIAST